MISRKTHPSVAKRLLMFALVVACVSPVAAQQPRPTTYGLSKPPLQVLDELGKLKIGTVPAPSAAERAYLKSTWERRQKNPEVALDADALLEAMLFASGVEDAAARKKLHERFEEITEQARAATKEAKTTYERGERLMTFLHKGVMAKGYDLEQSLLSEVVETGKYNCVSSTAMVYLIGSRLGLNFRLIAIPGNAWMPGHATLDLRDGARWVQVEATSPDGFDWEKKINRPGVIILGPRQDRTAGHEVDPLGVAAMIYSNRGGKELRSKTPDRMMAARIYLSALAIDPGADTATHNFSALLTNWGPELVEQKDFEAAVTVAAFGRTIFPGNGKLETNQSFVWSKYILALLDEKKDREAVAAVARAASALPDSDRFKTAAVWFRDAGEGRRAQAGWEGALELIDRGLKAAPAGEKNQLLGYRSSIFRRWSQALLDQNDAAGSFKILQRGFALNPKDDQMEAGLAYHTQEALRFLARDRGVAAAIEHFREIRKLHPESKDVSEMGEAFARRRVRGMADEGHFEQALAAARELAPLVGEVKGPQLGGLAFELWGRSLAKDKQWKQAIAKFQQGMKEFPEATPRLTEVSIYTINCWARTHMDQKDWDEAVAVYEAGLKNFPESSLLNNNRDYCKHKKGAE
jgi:tetratricopeptide (TPR) repeat protein